METTARAHTATVSGGISSTTGGMPPQDTPPQTPTDYRPYSQIDLADSQLKRLPMWARLAIANADARLNKGNRERAALLAALENGIGFYPVPSAQRTAALAAIAQARGDA